MRGRGGAQQRSGPQCAAFRYGTRAAGTFPQRTYFGEQIGSVPGIEYECMASAAWVDEQTLNMEISITDIYLGGLRISFAFKGEEIGLFMTKQAESFWTNTIKDSPEESASNTARKSGDGQRINGCVGGPGAHLAQKGGRGAGHNLGLDETHASRERESFGWVEFLGEISQTERGTGHLIFAQQGSGYEEADSQCRRWWYGRTTQLECVGRL